MSISSDHERRLFRSMAGQLLWHWVREFFADDDERLPEPVRLALRSCDASIVGRRDLEETITHAAAVFEEHLSAIETEDD